jgi:hypothetical protein
VTGSIAAIARHLCVRTLPCVEALRTTPRRTSHFMIIYQWTRRAALLDPLGFPLRPRLGLRSVVVRFWRAFFNAAAVPAHPNEAPGAFEELMWYRLCSSQAKEGAVLNGSLPGRLHMNVTVFRTRLITIAVLLSAVSLAAQGAKYKEENTPAGKMYVIEGKEHPEDIPEHAYWRHSFHKLANIKKLNSTERLAAIGLSPKELALVLKTAVEQETRDNDCHKSMTDRQDALKAQHASQEAIDQIYFDVTLECRYKDLAARDTLLEALSPEGRDQLMAWVQNTRRGMTAYVPVNELEFFRRPQ